VLDTEIRPMLIADGGDVELHDVDGDRVLVKLQGACGGCASSTATQSTPSKPSCKTWSSPPSPFKK
jgi:Fe-S cluster biogenesis protein NfuA